MPRVAKWRALLFFRHVNPAEIDGMDFHSLRHWGTLAQIELDAKTAALPKPRGR